MRKYVLALLVLFSFNVKAQIAHSNNLLNQCPEGDHFFSIYQFGLALTAYDSCYKNNKRNAYYLNKAAKCYEKLGKLKIAKGLFNELYCLDTTNVITLNQLALISIKQGEYRNAIDCIHALIQIDSTNSFYRKRNAELYLKLGDIEKSIINFEIAYTLNPEDIEVIISLAEIYEGSELYSLSEKFAEKAGALNARNVNVLEISTRLAYKEKAYSKVISIVNTALKETADTSYYTMKLLGISYFHVKNYLKTISILENVVKNGYETEVVDYYLGLAYKANGNLEKSIRFFNRAIDRSVSENITRYYNNLAAVYQEQGMHVKSIITYQTSYRYSRDKLLLYHLARNYDAYYKDKKTALMYFEKYIASNDSVNIDFLDYSKHRISELKKAIHFASEKVY